jgi:hypothetical protein
MRKLFFFFSFGIFSSVCASPDPTWQVMEEYMCYYLNSVRELRSETPSRFWMFNDREYLLNNSGTWAPLGGEIPENLLEFIQYHAKLGVCFKGHKGVYLDIRYYEDGVWYCNGQYKGEDCPYHVNIQMPGGGSKK